MYTIDSFPYITIDIDYILNKATEVTVHPDALYEVCEIPNTNRFYNPLVERLNELAPKLVWFTSRNGNTALLFVKRLN